MRRDLKHQEVTSSSIRRRRPRWILQFALVACLLLAVAVFLAPWFLASPAIVNSAIQRFGGLETVASAGGWSVHRLDVPRICHRCEDDRPRWRCFGKRR